WPSNAWKPAKTRKKSRKTWATCWVISWGDRKEAVARAATRATPGFTTIEQKRPRVLIHTAFKAQAKRPADRITKPRTQIPDPLPRTLPGEVQALHPGIPTPTLTPPPEVRRDVSRATSGVS